MALQASNLDGEGTPQNSMSFAQIEAEFGQNSGRTLGNYRMNNLDVGNLTEVPLDRDGCGLSANGSIPVDNQEIKFSDFYSARLNVIVDFHSGSNENRVNAKTDRYNAASASGNYLVVGGGSKPTNTSGKKIIIHVNKEIGSAKGNVQNCALRTGSWDSGTDLRVEVGNSGIIAGAGGDGGEGGGSEDSNGVAGGVGSSGLGIDYTHAAVIVTTEGNGKLIGGGGGGGGGGHASGRPESAGKPFMRADGGGGGGGAGIPAGDGGEHGEGEGEIERAPQDGGEGGELTGGLGGVGSERNRGGEGNNLEGGTGGNGGNAASAGTAGASSSAGGGEWEHGPFNHNGSNGGNAGSAIRRVSGAPSPNTSGASTTGSTTATGVA